MYGMPRAVDAVALILAVSQYKIRTALHPGKCGESIEIMGKSDVQYYLTWTTKNSHFLIIHQPAGCLRLFQKHQLLSSRQQSMHLLPQRALQNPQMPPKVIMNFLWMIALRSQAVFSLFHTWNLVNLQPPRDQRGYILRETSVFKEMKPALKTVAMIQLMFSQWFNVQGLGVV